MRYCRAGGKRGHSHEHFAKKLTKRSEKLLRYSTLKLRLQKTLSWENSCFLRKGTYTKLGEEVRYCKSSRGNSHKHFARKIAQKRNKFYGLIGGDFGKVWILKYYHSQYETCWIACYLNTNFFQNLKVQFLCLFFAIF